MGSIPACAGEPGRARTPAGRGQVYPRVCGGTSPGEPLPALPAGLSPRVRGNPSCQTTPPGTDGSIPACAGEPPPVPLQHLLVEVYPRVCGGT